MINVHTSSEERSIEKEAEGRVPTNRLWVTAIVRNLPRVSVNFAFKHSKVGVFDSLRRKCPRPLPLRTAASIRRPMNLQVVRGGNNLL
ncbi:hypothetical protein Esti_005545 [Eimeria stiedai]